MRKTLATLMGIFAFLLLITNSWAQELPWTTKSKKAKELTSVGVNHMKNIETAQAYDKFLNAVELDPNFSIPLTFLATLTTGKTSEAYAARALKSAENKTEGEKIFASIAPRDTTRKNFPAAFTKLHEIYPDGTMVGFYYVFSRTTPEEQFTAAQDYVKKFPNEPCMYNLLGYLNMSVKKDTVAAKANFDKYLQMYPEGANAYDSMGEYYFNVGDLENSEKYYKMALEKYPFNTSSTDKLKEIKTLRDKTTVK